LPSIGGTMRLIEYRWVINTGRLTRRHHA